jgi:hypothetical protein
MLRLVAATRQCSRPALCLEIDCSMKYARDKVEFEVYSWECPSGSGSTRIQSMVEKYVQNLILDCNKQAAGVTQAGAPIFLL